MQDTPAARDEVLFFPLSPLHASVVRNVTFDNHVLSICESCSDYNACSDYNDFPIFYAELTALFSSYNCLTTVSTFLFYVC